MTSSSSSSLPSYPSLNPSSITGNISDNLCGICNFLIADEDKSLMCHKCEKWIHTKCTKMTDIRYEHHQVNPEVVFECRICRTCGICNKFIASNHKFIDCSACENYVHIKCNRFDSRQYDRYLKDNSPTFCFKCNQENFPFLTLMKNNTVSF